jgi:hypothetical protein
MPRTYPKSCINGAPLQFASPNPIHLETLDCLMADTEWGTLDISEVSTIIYLVSGNYDAIYEADLAEQVAAVAAKFHGHDCIKLWVEDYQEAIEDYEE